ncbi:FMN-binding protein [Gudongella sp. DL1XJH-153]|uniref:FMN-binding protein n=1 Tax=Gudongella sp. DL1XJH-153 TaxID=3409804 RepID=UPI003BB77089
MKKLMVILLTLAMALSLAACSGGEEPAAEGGEPVVLTGVGEGFGGDITVEVTLEGDTITSVEVLSHEESAGISDPAIEETPAAIVAANSTEVDTVSGATYTSDGIIEAVNAALESAE